jgi:hypothetical protein
LQSLSSAALQHQSIRHQLILVLPTAVLSSSLYWWFVLCCCFLAAAAAAVLVLQGVMWQALCRAHGRVFLLTAVIKIVHDLVMFAQPYILEQVGLWESCGAPEGPVTAACLKKCHRVMTDAFVRLAVCTRYSRVSAAAALICRTVMQHPFHLLACGV